MKKIVPKHPLAIRWMHWINFPILAAMIWSGLLIYWANDVYKIHLGHNILFAFFPESFYKSLNISYRLAEGMAFHFVFMWVFFLNGLVYVTYTLVSGEWRYLLPNRHSFKEAWLTVLHDLHIRKTAPPQLKYNGAQKIAYTGVILMGLGSVLTGLAIFKPVQFAWLTWIFGGYGPSRVIHFMLTLGYCLFFIIHVIQVILAGWNNFRAMVAGFDVVNEPPATAIITNPPATATAITTNPPATATAIITNPPATTIIPDPPPIPAKVIDPTQKKITRRTVISFTTLALLGAAAWKSWFLIKNAAHSDGVQSPLRTGLDIDDKIFKHTLSDNHLVPTFPKTAAARNVRYNANVGLSTNGYDLSKWALQVTRNDNTDLQIGLDELRQLPRTEIVYEFKCIEGWSQVSWWGGVKFSDFIQHFNLQPETAHDYVGLSTPDDQYYIGIDTPSALHPQTILAYEMNGQPLPTRHGAPLRLIIPVKYGVKNLKRVGKLFFSDTRPRDYWFERGYDYYCGL
jgi:DMSO/TMAO reductase YedYZ molybdopterin-dependent catalytic subunit/thiosulfate reductase cytochrome b subunit